VTCASAAVVGDGDGGDGRGERADGVPAAGGDRRAGRAGAIVFDHRGVTASARAVMTVNFGAWGGDGTPMSVGDDDGDGTVDRTDTLSDEN